ncbi:MAG TPA: hypothetical protein VED37_04745 [Ktedonobacteraceae bacterium]|nr:hypothetical protein [Ktedonobacteraceae bacterium]
MTFFGLFALIETEARYVSQGIVTYFVRLLAFSMFLIYCLNSWGPTHNFVPGFPGFEWSYLNGLLVWGIPLIGALMLPKVRDARVNTSLQVVTKK